MSSSPTSQFQLFASRVLHLAPCARGKSRITSRDYLLVLVECFAW